MFRRITQIDRNGLVWLTDKRHPILNRVMELASRSGDWEAWTALFASLLAVPGRPRQTAARALPRMLGALALCFALKRLAKRERPSVAIEGISTLLADPDPYSFPSSHAATSWAAYLTMARELGGLAWFLTIPAVAVSYSRMHVGAHYPLDVLVGSAIGSLIGGIA